MKKERCFTPAMQEGVFLLLLSGWLLGCSFDAYEKSYIRDWVQSPSLFPVLVSGFLALLGVVILAQGVREKHMSAAEKKGNTRQVCILLGMSMLYLLALAVIRLPYWAVTISAFTFAVSTFELTTAAFLAAMMAYLGVRSKRVLVLVPIAVSAFLSVMFRTLLRVLLP